MSHEPKVNYSYNIIGRSKTDIRLLHFRRPVGFCQVGRGFCGRSAESYTTLYGLSHRFVPVGIGLFLSVF